MQKTYTPDCLTHRSVKNTGQERQYMIRGYHPAIVSKADWNGCSIAFPVRYTSGAESRNLRLRHFRYIGTSAENSKDSWCLTLPGKQKTYQRYA